MSIHKFAPEDWVASGKATAAHEVSVMGAKETVAEAITVLVFRYVVF